MRKLALLAMGYCTWAYAGVAITLVPSPSQTEYQPGQFVNVGIFAQLTAGSPTSIRARLIQFDLGESDPALIITPVDHHLLADIGPIPFWDLSGSTICANDEASCGTNYFIDGSIVADDILNVTYTGLTTSGSFMVTLNQTGRKQIGELRVQIPYGPDHFVLDVLNENESDDNFGAEVRHGFGVTADPGSVIMRAENGEVTGGRLVLTASPGAGPDCNGNSILDEDEDCNQNGLPDPCETTCKGDTCGCLGPYGGDYFGASIGSIVGDLDCGNQINLQFVTSHGPILFQTGATMSDAGVITGTGTKIQVNGQFDFKTCTATGTWSLFGGEPGSWTMHLTRECLPDCNANDVPDSCDIRDFFSPDCNNNSAPDECDLTTGSSYDCNHNEIPDECENPPVFAISMSDPADGFVDVRQDRSITGQTLQGIDRVRMGFTCQPHDAVTGQPFTTDSFEVTTTSGIAPLVFSILDAAAPNTFDIVLSDPIPPGAWTTITANVVSPDGVAIDSEFQSVSLGFLPGDVNGNGRTTPADILTLIDHLNGVLVPPLLSRRCDIDRSGHCVPGDIVRLIDLLNGINTSRAWLNVELPPNQHQ